MIMLIKFGIFLPKCADTFFWCRSIWFVFFFRIFHLMVCSMFLSFSSQMCSLRVISFFLCTSQNDDLCWLYLVVSKSYIAFFIFFSVFVTAVLYTTHFVSSFHLIGSLLFPSICRFLLAGFVQSFFRDYARLTLSKLCIVFSELALFANYCWRTWKVE